LTGTKPLIDADDQSYRSGHVSQVPARA
jgi:hypothetical protein